MIVYLLDVNLLLALSDPLHEHHEIAHDWFAATGQYGWATCPLTENSFVRIASHPQYPNRPGNPRIVLNLLRQFCALNGHHFWAETVSLRDWVGFDDQITHKQLTDVYLLYVAKHWGGKLATLDQRIPAEVVTGGIDLLTVIK